MGPQRHVPNLKMIVTRMQVSPVVSMNNIKSWGSPHTLRGEWVCVILRVIKMWREYWNFEHYYPMRSFILLNAVDSWRPDSSRMKTVPSLIKTFLPLLSICLPTLSDNHAILLFYGRVRFAENVSLICFLWSVTFIKSWQYSRITDFHLSEYIFLTGSRRLLVVDKEGQENKITLKQIGLG